MFSSADGAIVPLVLVAPSRPAGYRRAFDVILGLLYTGMQWKYPPVPGPTTAPSWSIT